MAIVGYADHLKTGRRGAADLHALPDGIPPRPVSPGEAGVDDYDGRAAIRARKAAPQDDGRTKGLKETRCHGAEVFRDVWQ